MPEWLYEAGIGEARAALVADGRIIRARIELDDGARRVGHVEPARLVRRADATGRGQVAFADGTVALLAAVPPGTAEGASLLVELTRTTIPERANPKPAIVRIAPAGAAPAPGPTLADRIAASGQPVRPVDRFGADALEAAGWSELLDAAHTGLLPFPGGLLRMSITPAMTLFDVDGCGAPADLATAGAAAAARAILCFGIGGSIGIDLPTAGDRAARQAAAAAFDAVLPLPFERTAVNGFGFLQVVRRRARASLPELLAADRPAAAARALLRAADRAAGVGERILVAAPAVIARITPNWADALSARIGACVALRADPALAISASHVAVRHP